jgi:hypothetical protein
MSMIALIAAALVSGAPVTISEHPDSVVLTVYHHDGIGTSDLMDPANAEIRDEGVAFITETRTVDLPAGPAVIRFRGVVSTMVPQTAEIQGLPGGGAEQNFDYDLLSPGSLLAKSIGQTVHLVRTDPKTGRRTEQAAVVRSGPNGAVLDIDGKIEALDCSALPEKLVFDQVPEGLADTPTLSVRTNAPAAGRYTIKLSYIATGLNWNADYVAHIAADGRTLDLTGWITLANFSATGFGQIPVQVVAGRLNTTGEDTPINAALVTRSAECWPTDIDWATRTQIAAAGQQEFRLYAPAPPPPPPPSISAEAVVVTGARVPDPRRLGDYKLYSLPESTTVSAQQTKQIQFLDQRGVRFSKVYSYTIDPVDPAEKFDPPSVLLRLVNRADTGLGKPLPAGDVSVMEPADDGAMVLAGQADIRDNAVGEPIELDTGNAMDVAVDRRLVQSHSSGQGRARRTQNTFEVSVENDKSIPIAFEFRQYMAQGARILSESSDHAMDRGAAVWSYQLKPGEHALLAYTIELPY